MISKTLKEQDTRGLPRAILESIGLHVPASAGRAVTTRWPALTPAASSNMPFHP